MQLIAVIAMCGQWYARVFLVIWATSLTFVGACLMVGHWIPLPTPTSDQLLNGSPALTRVDGTWSTFHFLYADCPCSRRIFENLVTRSSHQDVNEQIVLVGDAPELASRAKARGFHVDEVAPEELKVKYAVEAAPLLVVVDPRGRVRYCGGYTERKQGFEIKDTVIVSNLLAGEEVESLPVYGCAVSRSLQAVVDPLRIKSSSRD